MLGAYLSFVQPFIEDMREMQRRNDEKLQEIADRYHAAVNLPRKKKKRVRKECIVEYSIFSYAKDNLFNFGF